MGHRVYISVKTTRTEGLATVSSLAGGTTVDACWAGHMRLRCAGSEEGNLGNPSSFNFRREPWAPLRLVVQVRPGSEWGALLPTQGFLAHPTPGEAPVHRLGRSQ